MGKKLYRPIVEDGDHLVKSKKNKNRVRGVSQDSNNKTTNIVEWEEVEIEEHDDYCEPQKEALTPEQQMIVEALAEVMTNLVITGAKAINDKIVQPWWKGTAKPWIKVKVKDVKRIVSGKTKAEEILEQNEYTNTMVLKEDIQIDEYISEGFEKIYFDMSSEEAKNHIMKLIYYILGIAYEIKILSNARIINQAKNEENRIETQEKFENMLVQKTSDCINGLLSDDKLVLRVSESKQLFNLLGGGVRFNNEYVPVDLDKVGIAIESMKPNKNTK